MAARSQCGDAEVGQTDAHALLALRKKKKNKKKKQKNHKGTRIAIGH